MRLATLAVMALAIVGGCARPALDEPEPLPLDDSPSERGTGRSASSSPAPSGSGEVVSPAPSGSAARGTDAGPQARRWKGTLSATKPVQFGGGQNCVYRITLQGVKVDIVSAANGDIVAANVTATAIEQVLTPSCSNTAIPAHTHTYALVTATVLPGGTGHLELAGLSTNRPAASLFIEGDLTAASPTLSLEWHRTDYGPPLDWRIAAQVTAVPQF
jgi:hypothetical protein